MRSTDGRFPAAVLVGTGGGDLAAVRALGRRGVDVWLAGPRRLASAASRYARGFLETPEAATDPAAFTAALRERAAAFPSPPVLIAVDDLSVGAVACAAGELAGAFRLTGPSPETTFQILDKARQYERVRAAGVPLPRTWVPEGPAHAAAIAAEASFPLLVKGRSAQRFRSEQGGLKAFHVARPGELRSTLEQVRDVVVQEVVPGGIERVYEYASFTDVAGRVRAAVVIRKLDEDPKPYGSATVAETVRVPELEALGRRVLEVFEFRGLAHSEWKLDERDGSFRFVELNPRIPVSASLHEAAGADTIWPAYAEAAGLPIATVEQRSRRVVWMRPELRLTRQGTLALPPRLPDSAPGRTRWVADLFDPRDPGPLTWEALHAVRRRMPTPGRL